MAYRYEALSVEGFIQQIAVNYIPHGYWFYVAGRIPSHKNVAAVDQKLISKYGIAINSWTRSRRKRQGLASVHYIRHLNFFVLLANEGAHPFRAEEARRVRDVREVPLRYGGYALGYVAGHSCVRIERHTLAEIRDEFLRRATHRSSRQLEGALRSLPFEPYAPIRLQLLMLLRQVNKKRKAAGLEVVSKSALRFYRNIYAPFDGAEPSPRSHLLRKTRKRPLVSGPPD
jgi:hypothetical protein